MLELIAVLTASASDRVRGSGDTFYMSSSLWGAVLFCAALYIATGELMQLVAIGYMVGELAGWGHVLGSVYSRRLLTDRKTSSWQIGILKTNMFLALVVRGLIWGVPVGLCGAAYGAWIGLSLFIAVSVSFVAAPYLARLHKRVREDREGGIEWQNWQRGENIRGALCILIILIMTKGA